MIHSIKSTFHYDTVSESIDLLRAAGFVNDLQLKDAMFFVNGSSYPVDDFEIVDLYRYEGASDPADEAIVYALQSADGLRGILVTGYGVTTDESSEEVLKDLHYKYRSS